MLKNIQLKIMDQKEAMEIADCWKYNEPYDFYDMTADQEDYEEIIDPHQRTDTFYSVIDNNQLVGYFCLFPKDSAMNEIELGLGMKPGITGKGFGEQFVKEILSYIEKHFSFQVIWLSVADFNQRAIKVYERAGFKYVTEKIQKTNGGEYLFIVMNNLK
ncbi:GNAT family N-acetyltransferase [Oceanobacillus timonensis]|uniref:GNAT family N-acetyltransferase n=1 Tax=Oceanobacillus timonensis TaxID=1926285 RepID=UPI001C4E1DF2|nr:GNAT family N-acetyltransferase [Oceanobacillus timonensis]